MKECIHKKLESRILRQVVTDDCYKKETEVLVIYCKKCGKTIQKEYI